VIRAGFAEIVSDALPVPLRAADSAAFALHTAMTKWPGLPIKSWRRKTQTFQMLMFEPRKFVLA
jgi:hypothetical protein